MLRSLACIAALLLPALPTAAQSRLKSHTLDGLVKTPYWTFLASQNPYRIPDKPTMMTGTMTVASPGYGAQFRRSLEDGRLDRLPGAGREIRSEVAGNLYRRRHPHR